jgi:hypothetical protein
MGRIYCRISLLILVCFSVLPALAETNLSGVWVGNYSEDYPDRLPGPELGDYGGLPINDAVRLRAQSWSASLIALPEYQCRVHPSDYASSFANIRIWEERDPISEELIAVRIQHFAWQTRRTIWMDGREHPSPNAQHSWQGFSTGQWEGDMLKVKTTHLKEGWVRRNGLPRSDQATLFEYFIRNDDILTLVSIVEDPVYLTEPLVRTSDWVTDPGMQLSPFSCIPTVEIERPRGAVIHHLPDTNEYLYEYADTQGITHRDSRGGAETMYPEYLDVVREYDFPEGE